MTVDTILIIDDSAADQFLSESVISTILPEVRVEFAHDGQEAIEMLFEQNLEPDLILLDINMPRMGGHEFLIKYTELHDQEIPVIAMLSSSDEERDKDAVKSFKCVKEYFVKPIKREAILNIIDVVFDMKQKLSGSN